MNVVHAGLPFHEKSETIFNDLLYLYPCVSFQFSHMLSGQCLWYSGNSCSRTSIAGIEFILSTVSSESDCVNVFFGIGFTFTILLGMALRFSFHWIIASFTSLHQFSASLTSYRCRSVYAILFMELFAGPSLSTRI